MPKLQVNRALERFLTTSKPIKVAVGGRGSGKSIGFGDMLTMKMATERADIYCLREYQDSINDSVHRVFSDSIEKRLDLHGWTIQDNKVQAPNGAATAYRGAARNPDSIQSAQGYKYSWFEEAHRASKASLDKLLPTIIRNPGAECWFSGNPQSSADAFSQRFINPYQKQLDQDGYYEDEIHLIQVVNWRDNPWWNKEQEMLRVWDYENRPRNEYNWIWEGKFNDSVDDGIIKPEWIDAAVDAHLKLPNIARGGIRIGFDPADEGSDDKAVTVTQGGLVKECRSWPEGDLDAAIGILFDTALEFRAVDIVYDAIGIGAAVKIGMGPRIATQPMRLHAFVGSQSPLKPKRRYNKDIKNEDLFRNIRAQTYWNLRTRFENTYKHVVKGEFIDPAEMISLSSEMQDFELLKSELLRIPRKRTPFTNMIQIMSKQEMKKQKIPSPNLADSLMMALADINDHSNVSRPKVNMAMPKRGRR